MACSHITPALKASISPPLSAPSHVAAPLCGSEPLRPSWDTCDCVQGPQMIQDKLPSQDSCLRHTCHIREGVQARRLDLAVSEATVQPRTDSLRTPQEGHPKAPQRQCLLRRGQNWGLQGRGQPWSPELGSGGEMQSSWVHPSPAGVIAGWVGRAALG